MSYAFVKNCLFRMDPETSHHVTLKSIRLAEKAGLLGLFVPPPVSQPVSLMGLQFPNAVGLAAGLDKNAECIRGMSRLGFGFIEVGTVTPRPQAGNPKPRLFRIEEREGIINRMGFNNEGVDYLVRQVKASNFKGVLGINIGKNKDTPAENALEDYLYCLEKVYDLSSYVTINISSPNTPGLRALQMGDSLQQLLEGLKEKQHSLSRSRGRYVPLVLKVAPDLTEEEIVAVATQLKAFEMDGVIATNTTLSRSGVEGLPNAKETGGLSGAPLTQRATQILKTLRANLGDGFPIIASGGVMSAQDAIGKLNAGAQLVQIYSGLIYRGPGLIREVAEAIAARAEGVSV
ncbi:MAG: quinone-dependent dihydroorotate dehydrogenase [Hahellaceae bacterium]|nr:quinone-dependent dihydroorotate dehydrogenase [Hahellaceae bacterium]